MARVPAVGHTSNRPDPAVMKEEARARVDARRQILSCTRCELHSGCRRPVPWSGPAPARRMVLGEAPGAVEDKEGAPFVGPAGRLLRRLMTQAGIEPGQLAWANVVCCFPHRTPVTEEVSACSRNLLTTLEVVRPHHVLVVGNVALSVYRPDLRIGAAHGKMFWIGADGPVMFPIYHPAAALRDPNLTAVIGADLWKWKAVCEALTPEALVSESCVACGVGVDRYDPDGMPYCERHWQRGMVGWRKSVKARARMGEDKVTQRRMFG